MPLALRARVQRPGAVLKNQNVLDAAVRVAAVLEAVHVVLGAAVV